MSDSVLENTDISAAVEALLFVAAEPVSIPQLANALEVSPAAIESVIKELEETLNNRGLRLQMFSGRVQLTTAPEFAEKIERFLDIEATSHLSHAALETLAVIAYQQPVTRPQLDSIRGVNSDGVLKSLLGKGLLQEVGRADSPGRPILYSTTPLFLQHFGLASILDLPPLNITPDKEKEEQDAILKS